MYLAALSSSVVNIFLRNLKKAAQASNSSFPSIPKPINWFIPRSAKQSVEKTNRFIIELIVDKAFRPLIYYPAGTCHAPHGFGYCHLSSNHLCGFTLRYPVSQASAWGKNNERSTQQKALSAVSSCLSGLPPSPGRMQTPDKPASSPVFADACIFFFLAYFVSSFQNKENFKTRPLLFFKI